MKSKVDGFEVNLESRDTSEISIQPSTFISAYRLLTSHLDTPKMDRGAARSKKRIQQLERAALAAKEEEQRLKLEKKSKPKTKKSQSKAGVDGRDDKPGGPSSSKLLPEPQSKDPELYRAKAIRSSNALIWPFQLPPASLDGITRVDMTNAGVEDISWLKSSQVRWLSLSGCPVKDWEAVGTLSELTGVSLSATVRGKLIPVLNVNECGLDHLPKAFGNLTKLKAFVGMSNPWKKIDQGIISQWTELNSLSTYPSFSAFAIHRPNGTR